MPTEKPAKQAITYSSFLNRNKTRHITSNFVFWEYGSKANAMPILGFIEESKYILEDDWSNYVMYDYAAEMESFELTLEQSLNLKLG